jgi:WD40 repeat protein
MKEEAVILAHDSHVMDVLFSKPGDTLLSIRMDNKLKLWTIPSWEAKATFEGT